MSESELGLFPARSQLLRVQSQPRSRERGSPSRAGRTPGPLSASRVSGARSPRSRRGARRTPELRGCLWNPVPLASRVPRSGSPRDTLSPGPPWNKVTAAPAPGHGEGNAGRTPGLPVTARRVSPLSQYPRRKLLLPNEGCRTVVKVRAAAAQGDWGCWQRDFPSGVPSL